MTELESCLPILGFLLVASACAPSPRFPTSGALQVTGSCGIDRVDVLAASKAAPQPLLAQVVKRSDVDEGYQYEVTSSESVEVFLAGGRLVRIVVEVVGPETVSGEAVGDGTTLQAGQWYSFAIDLKSVQRRSGGVDSFDVPLHVPPRSRRVSFRVVGERMEVRFGEAQAVNAECVWED